jgi:hypothetical protein
MNNFQNMNFQTARSVRAPHRQYWSWWYQFTTPPAPPANASLERRELQRRARLASIIIFVLFIVCLISLFNGLFGTNPMLVPIVGVMAVLTVISIFLNRKGYITSVGVINVVAYTFGVVVNLLTNPGGLTMEVVPYFSLLAMPEILTAAMLSTWWVVLDIIVNVLFCFAAVTWMPRSSEIASHMTIVYINSVIVPFVLQLIIAAICILASTSLLHTIRERDQAEELAKLEGDLAEQMSHDLVEKQALEMSIAAILDIQSRVANGDYSARVPLTPDNILWPVAGTLNNLIARLQYTHHIEQRLSLTEQSASALLTQLQRKRTGQPPVYTKTNTVIDPIAWEVLSLPTSSLSPFTASTRERRTPPPEETSR